MLSNHFKLSPFHVKALSITLFFTALFLLSSYLGLVEHFTLSNLKNIIEQNTTYSLILFIVIFVAGNFIQIPGLLFLATAVLTLGKINGGLVTYLAATISCTVSFLIIRFMGGGLLREFKSSWVTKLFKQLDNNPIKSIFILRSVFQTQPILNYGLALSGVSFRNHFVATLIALPLPLFLYCYFFEYIANYLGFN